MSWQAYVDTNLVGTGKVSKAAILGLQGGVWATSGGFTLSEAEQKAAVDGFKNLDKVRSEGIKLAGAKYFTINADDDIINGKKGESGYVFAKTKQAILVGIYEAPIQQTECTAIVVGLAEYLKGVGY